MAKPLDDWGDFPKISAIVNGEKRFYSLREAIPLWNSWFLRVEDGGELLLEDFSVRKMTREESYDFRRRVDDYSASK